MRTIVACSFASLCSGLNVAQATASVVQPVQIQMSSWPTATLNVGPVPPSGIELANGFNTTLSRVRIDPLPVAYPSAAQGWLVRTSLNQLSLGGVAATANATGRIEIRMVTPFAASGVLHVRPLYPPPTSPSVTGDVTIDTNCDGTPDFLTGVATHSDAPLTAGPAGTPIWVDLNLNLTVTSTASGGLYGQAIREWAVMFVPNAYGLQAHATGCHNGLSWGRSLSSGNLQFAVVDLAAGGSAPTIAAAWLLVGTAPAVTPLPLPPACVVHVGAPVLFLPNATSNPWIKRWEVPALTLPPGMQLFAQVAYLRYSGSALTTAAFSTF